MASVSVFLFSWIMELLEFAVASSREFNLSRKSSMAHVDTIVR